MYKLKKDLWASGFMDWAHAKYNTPNPIPTWEMYVNVEYELGGDDHADERAFDRFVVDLKEFRAQKAAT